MRTCSTDAAEPSRYVYIEKAKCPECGSVDVKTTRSTDQGDGSISRRTVCKSSGYHFFVIVE
jgi:hypothetical protein